MGTILNWVPDYKLYLLIFPKFDKLINLLNNYVDGKLYLYSNNFIILYL